MKRILASLMTVIVVITSLIGNGNMKVKAESQFITVNIYNEFGKCVEVIQISGTNKNLTSDSKNLIIEGNKIKYTNESYFGYKVENIRVQNSDTLINYIKTTDNSIVYDDSGKQKELNLMEFIDIGNTEFEGLRGAVVNISLKEEMASVKFITDKGRVCSVSTNNIYNSTYALTKNLSNKNYKIDESVNDATGYDLVGWRGSVDNKLYKVGDTIDITVKQNYIAEFKSQLKTITYIGYDNTVIKTEQAEFGTKVKLPETAPEVEGKEFDFWCKNSNLSSDYSATEILVSGDIKLYAVYKVADMVIIYTDDSGNEVKKKVKYGSQFTSIGDLDKRGYTTVWKDKDGNVYDANTQVKKNITLYANYVPNRYKIDIITNGGEVEFERCNIQNGTIEFGDEIVIKSIDKYGYDTLEVRYNNLEIGKDTDGKYRIKITQDKDSTITINYSKNKHTVKYIDELNKKEKEEYNIYYQQEIVMPEYTKKDGYTFRGWQLSTGEVKQPGDIVSMPNKDLKVTALWENINYVIKLNLDGGYFTDSNNLDEVVVLKMGDTYKLSKPTKTGYEFNGWKAKKGKVVNDVYTVETFDDEIDANWVKKKYSITVLPNGGFFKGSTNIQNIIGEYGDTIELETPIREGYTFKNWEVLSGNQESLKDNKVICGLGGITIGAVWIGSNGEIIDNNSENYVKPVDGTIDSSVILSEDTVKIAYAGCESTISLIGKVGVDKTNGVNTDYDNTINSDYTIQIDNYSNIANAKYQVVPSSTLSANVSLKEGTWETMSGNCIKLSKDRADGKYNIYFVVETVQGKKIMFRSTGFILDNTPASLDGIEDGKYYTNSITLNAIDTNGISSIKLNGTEVSNNTKISKSGKYKVELSDKAGNISIVNFILDKEKPSINIKNNRSYNKDIKIVVKDGLTGVSNIKLNGKTIKNNSKITKNGKYTIVVTDKAGNKLSINFKLDKVKPKVSLKKSKGAVKIKCSDSLSGIKVIKLNNKKIKNGSVVRKRGSYTLKVYDKANNVKTIKFKF